MTRMQRARHAALCASARFLMCTPREERGVCGNKQLYPLILEYLATLFGIHEYNANGTIVL